MILYTNAWVEMYMPESIASKKSIVTEENQMPFPDIEVRKGYHILLGSEYTPTDFVVMLYDRVVDYLKLIRKFSEICWEDPSWLKLTPESASRQISIAYINSDNWVGRGYLIVELADDQGIIIFTALRAKNYISQAPP